MSLPPLLHRGSVKNILGTPDAQQLIFAYSDRYSVFDWGEMPDHIPHKGACLSAMAHMFFDAMGSAEQWQKWSHPLVHHSNTLMDLKKRGLHHHMAKGMIDAEQQSVHIEHPTAFLHVHKVDVIRPAFDGTAYNYEAYQDRPTNALVPLEIIFRFGIPQGSSLMKRIHDEQYLRELGLSDKPSVGDVFEEPIIEFSTKLESTDVYIPFSKAQEMAGLTNEEALRLKETVYILALRLKDLFSASDLFLWDGKFEFAFSNETDEQDNRMFMLVDSIGPDELRLTYQGIQLSKECLRTPYRDSDWYNALEAAKSLAKDRGIQDWKQICTEELKQSPKPLEPKFIEHISQLYKSLSNAIAQQLYQKKIFADGWSLSEVAQKLQEQP